tara:strand:- start:130 stop:333 length:204 start_codon:yes stop_codon:yes gene_type:complete
LAINLSYRILGDDMVEEKLGQLKEDLEKVSVELDKLSQLRLKLLGAIEILTAMKEESEEPEVKEDDK